MKPDYMVFKESESFMKWFALYIILAAMAMYIVSTAIFLTMKGLSSISNPKLSGYVVITVLPYILMDLLYSLKKPAITISTITLKVVLSSLLSLVLLRAVGEINPGYTAETSFTACSLGVFACIMFLLDAWRHPSEMLPGLNSRVLVVGDDRKADDIRRLIDGAGHRYTLAGSVSLPLIGRESSSMDADGILAIAKRLKADKVVVSMAERRGAFPLKQMLWCKLSGIEVLDAPGMYERITGKLLVESITPSWFIFSSGFKVTALLMLSKRLMDILCSLLGLVFFAPFAPLVMLAIKLDSPGPIFFRQVRVGQGDVPFELIKFRSMRQDAEKGTGAVWALQSDPRVTRLGSFLRKSRIDEIPQLINVLAGQMSLVGPRPERPEFVRDLNKVIPYYSERHFVKPGVTGWAQVRYPYGASVEDALEKLRFDLYYIKNISLWFDIRIILLTVGVVLLRKGGR